MLICKGSREGGRKWRELMGVRFPVMADETSLFVKAFKFPSSFWNTCRSENLHKMALDKLSNNKVDTIEDKKKDAFQLGGEVLMDSKGRIVFVHRCKDSEDRPAVDNLIKLIPVPETCKEKHKKVSSMCLIM